VCKGSVPLAGHLRYTSPVATPLTDLNRKELTRRIKAARELRNVTQAQLADKFVEDGLDRSVLGKMERYDPDFPLVRSRLDSLVRHLGVPRRWFTSADTDLVVGLVPVEGMPPDQREALRTALQLLEDAARRRDQEGQPHPGASDDPGQTGERGG